jgi:WD40 repeat protein
VWSAKKVQSWDARTGQLVKTLVTTDTIVRDAALSFDGQRMVVVRDDNSAIVIDAASGATRFELRGEGEGGRIEGFLLGMQSAAFSPDGRRIVTVSGTDWTGVWDAETGALLAKLPRRYSPFVSFSPDGRRIMAADGGNVTPSAAIFDAETGEDVDVLRGHEKRVTAAAHDGAGYDVATASADDTARLWRLQPTTQGLVDDVKTRVPRCLTLEQRRKFHLSDEPPRWCITGAASAHQGTKDKWQGLWPFDGAAWKDWLAAADAARAHGGTPPELPASN